MRQYTIGVLIGNANSPHTRTLMRGVHDAAEKLNVNVIFFLGVHMTYYYRAYFGETVNNDYDYQCNVVYDYAKLGSVDALIISYGSLCIFLEDNNLQHFIDRFKGIPYVLLEERDPTGKGTSIISDNYNGMYRIVEHLIKDHGCKTLTYMGGPANNTDSQERKCAFIDAMTRNGITIKDDMFQIGDFSDCVEEQVNALLDAYPNMDAMVCANDVMAHAAYREIGKRGLIVGKDIAVTGYDDWDLAEFMTPPLTTVLQNEFDIGFNSLERAVELCEGKEAVELIAPAILKIRASCGCKNEIVYQFPKLAQGSLNIEAGYIDGIANAMLDRVLISTVNDEIRSSVYEQIRTIVESNLILCQSGDLSKFDKKQTMAQINELIAGKYRAYVSPGMLADAISAYLTDVMRNERNSGRLNAIADIITSIQHYVQSSVVKLNNDLLSNFQQDSMCMPVISREMMSQMENEEEFYRAPMLVLSAMRSKSSYLYLLEKPVSHEYGEVWKTPKKLYLASYHKGKKIVSYKPQERPVITAEHGIDLNVSHTKGYVMSAYNLYLGKYQYGVLLTEIDPNDMILVNLASLQISIALNFKELYEHQNSTQQKLEKLIEEVNEKNKILGFISEYDELTGCLNRRGFMEKAIAAVHNNINKKAVFLIADLDHLKEINDCFGHVEGDFALRSATMLLRGALGREVLLARIGGDEFTAILIENGDDCGEDIVNRIKEAFTNFNKSSIKPFYVELSTGYKEFICTQSIDFDTLIKESDKMMYEAKQKRKTSVVKKKNE